MTEIPRPLEEQPVDAETAQEFAERQRAICEFLRVNDITSTTQIQPQFIQDVFAHLIACAEDVPHKPISGLPDLDEY